MCSAASPQANNKAVSANSACCVPVVNCRLDKSVNTLTVERALLALVATWHRAPFESKTWARSETSSKSNSLKQSLGGAKSFELEFLQDELEEFFDGLDDEVPRQHSGTFEGSALSGVIMSAEEGFDWGSLPASAGEGRSRLRQKLGWAAYVSCMQASEVKKHSRRLFGGGAVVVVTVAVLRKLRQQSGPSTLCRCACKLSK
jgi:hypothetical protein